MTEMCKAIPVKPDALVKTAQEGGGNLIKRLISSPGEPTIINRRKKHDRASAERHGQGPSLEAEDYRDGQERKSEGSEADRDSGDEAVSEADCGEEIYEQAGDAVEEAGRKSRCEACRGASGDDRGSAARGADDKPR